MSKVSSARKVENTNKQMLQQLQDILEFCEEKGHQPENNSEFGKVLKNIQHIVYMRKRNGALLPNKAVSLLRSIKNYPTAVRQKRKELKFKEAKEKAKNYPTADKQKRKDLKFKEAKTKAEQRFAFEQRYEKIQKLTPYDLRIFEYMYGKEKFKQFINTDTDIIVTKALLDYFYTLYHSAHMFLDRNPDRIRFIIELYVGDYSNKNVKKLKATFEDYIKAPYKKDVPEEEQRQLFAKIEHKQALTLKEIGYVMFYASATIGEIMRSGYSHFHDRTKQMDSLLDLYLSGNATAVMSGLPPKLAKLYKYQDDMKLHDIPTDVLNSTGKVLKDFFTKEKE